MKKTMKPGDLFNKFQKKKKSYSESDMGSMKGYNPMQKSSGPAMNAFQKSDKPTQLTGSMKKMAKKKPSKKHKKNWIAGAIKHPGALHRELGVKAGNKIPAKTLAKAAKKGGKEGKRARLAETLKGFHHKKKSMKKMKPC